MFRANLLFGSLAAAAVFVFASSHGAAADIVTMDSFSVTGPAGGNFFTDPFNLTGTLSGTASSGVSTNTTPSNPVNYNVTGSFSESGGKATLDTANGAFMASPPPLDPLIQQVSASFAGNFLRSGAMGATGIFDLSVPATLGAVYGIEFIDLNLGHNGDVIGLRIAQTALGPRIELVNIDHFDGILTIVDSTVLDPSHDQIELNLFKNSSSDAIGGAFAYLDGGILGALTTFGSMTDLAADGARFMTPAFNAFAPVPEPSTLALVFAGLFGLGFLSRRKRKSD